MYVHNMKLSTSSSKSERGDDEVVTNNDFSGDEEEKDVSDGEHVNAGVSEDDDADVDVDTDADTDAGTDTDAGADTDVDVDAEGGISDGEESKQSDTETIMGDHNFSDNYDTDSDEDYNSDEDLQKIKKGDKKNYLETFHPESIVNNHEEVRNLSVVIRDKNGTIVDPFHKTLPILTKYEKTKILGLRAKQITDGATPFVKVPDNVIDGYTIASLELANNKCPFIIRRPLPNNSFEYWKVSDLENI